MPLLVDLHRIFISACKIYTVCYVRSKSLYEKCKFPSRRFEEFFFDFQHVFGGSLVFFFVCVRVKSNLPRSSHPVHLFVHWLSRSLPTFTQHSRPQSHSARFPTTWPRNDGLWGREWPRRGFYDFYGTLESLETPAWEASATHNVF